MRHRRLVERQTLRKVADACFIVGASQRGQDGETIGIGKRLEQLRLIGEVATRDTGGRAAARNRHAWMLRLESKIVNIAIGLVAFTIGGATAQTSAGSWTLGPPLPIGRSEVSVATIGTQIYLIGGYAPAGSNPTQLDSTGKVDVDQPLVQAFDIATQRWSDRAPIPRGMNHIGVTTYGTGLRSRLCLAP